MVALVTLISAHAETTFQSGPQRVALLEVYTSEGCSSCPPAESWLSEFKNQARLWKDIVPVAFHVDYWDGLGWKDRFAKEEYTSRQRAYSAAWGTSSVYTPGFVSMEQSGKDGSTAALCRNSGERPAGRLEVMIKNQTATITFSEEFRRTGTRSASGADGDGREFGCARRRESRAEVSSQFRRSGSCFQKVG